jgi:hypothetical protein
MTARADSTLSLLELHFASLVRDLLDDLGVSDLDALGVERDGIHVLVVHDFLHSGDGLVGEGLVLEY